MGEAGDVCALGLVCSIPGGGHRPWLCWPAVVGGGGFSGGD